MEKSLALVFKAMHNREVNINPATAEKGNNEERPIMV